MLFKQVMVLLCYLLTHHFVSFEIVIVICDSAQYNETIYWSIQIWLMWCAHITKTLVFPGSFQYHMAVQPRSLPNLQACVSTRVYLDCDMYSIQWWAAGWNRWRFVQSKYLLICVRQLFYNWWLFYNVNELSHNAFTVFLFSLPQ